MSRTIDIDELFPQVKTHAPSAPEPLIARYIREAAQELCQHSRLWRRSERFALTMPDCQGVLTDPDQAIVGIDNARLDGTSLEPVTIWWLDEAHPGWEEREEEAAARYITQTGPDRVTVFPRQSGELSVRLILKPSRTAETLPAFLLEHHEAAIGKGAAGRVLATPGEWANPELGMVMLGEFERLKATTKITAAKGQQGGRIRTRGSFF